MKQKYLWKVYANCCKRIEPVKEIPDYMEKEVIDKTIDEMMDYFLEYDLVSDYVFNEKDELDDDKYSELCSLLEKHLKEEGILEVGDYQLQYSTDKPERPNKCDDSYFLIEDYIENNKKPRINKNIGKSR